jgi:hypothetical protein
MVQLWLQIEKYRLEADYGALCHSVWNKIPPAPFFQGGRDARILLPPFSKGGWGGFESDFIGS